MLAGCLHAEYSIDPDAPSRASSLFNSRTGHLIEKYLKDSILYKIGAGTELETYEAELIELSS